MSSKTGKSAMDIFSPTLPVVSKATKEAELVSKPPEQAEPPRVEIMPDKLQQDDWAKVTVLLFNRQIVYLDRLTASIRENTRSSVKRAEVIRALIDTIIDSGLDKELCHAGSEDEIRSLLSSKLAS